MVEEVDGTYGPAFEEAIEVEHLLAEPKSESLSVDRLCFGKDDSGKCFKDAKFSWEVEYSFTMEYGGLNPIKPPREDDLKLDVLDGFLNGIDEVDDIYAAHDLSTACKGFLLDKLPELNSGTHETPNTSSDSLSPGISRSSNAIHGLQCKVRAPSDENHRTMSKFEWGEQANDCTGAMLLHSQNIDEFDYNDGDDEKQLVTVLPRQKGKTSVRKSKVETHACDESISQAPYDFRPRRARPQEYPLKQEPESDGELTASEVEDGSRRTGKSKSSGNRRKRQRMWTLCEVVKLVDGISQFGVGKWTDIKRLHFPSAAHRTPVDLRDKWRNLLKASLTGHGTRKRCAPEAEGNLKSAVRSMPKHLVHRIQELAAIYPYPNKNGGSKFSSFGSDRDLPHRLAGESGLLGHGRRVYRRKSSA